MYLKSMVYTLNAVLAVEFAINQNPPILRLTSCHFHTRPAAQMLQLSATRVTRKAVTGPPHARASAPTIIAGTGLIAPVSSCEFTALV